MKRPKMNTISRLSGAVHGSLSVCPRLGGAVAGLCALWPVQWSCQGSLGPCPCAVRSAWGSEAVQGSLVSPQGQCATNKHNLNTFLWLLHYLANSSDHLPLHCHV